MTHSNWDRIAILKKNTPKFQTRRKKTERAAGVYPGFLAKLRIQLGELVNVHILQLGVNLVLCVHNVLAEQVLVDDLENQKEKEWVGGAVTLTCPRPEFTLTSGSSAAACRAVCSFGSKLG